MTAAALHRAEGPCGWIGYRRRPMGGPVLPLGRAPGRQRAAALGAGCDLELVRVWYGQQARALEQRLKQRRKPTSTRSGAAQSLQPLCPLCNPAGWSRRYPNLPDPTRPARRRGGAGSCTT